MRKSKRSHQLGQVSAPDPHLLSARSPRMEGGTAESERHQLEQEVRRRLLARPELRFSSLVIRRIHDGVCLEGILEVDDDCPDVCRLAQAVEGVERVLNHLMVRRPVSKN